MFVLIRTMRVTVNQRGTAMLAQEVFNGGGRGIHRLHGFGAFGVLALLAQRGGDGLALGQRFGQEALLPDRHAYLLAEGLILGIVGTQHVAVR